MYFLRSRNQELNTYINSFIEINYQPIKMFCWRILILCLLAIVLLVKDYQHYGLSLTHWFAWSPLLVVLAGVLTVNFQSSYLGSMTYQYRYYDTSFQIARRFADFEYTPLINGLEKKLKLRAGACRKSYIILGSLLIGLLSLINSQAIIWQLIFTENTQYIVTSIYVCLILTLVLSAVLESIALVARKRQLELIELSLFWIKSASTLKYIA